ncbi:glycerophosphodiester phosphodiesterase [Galbibacter sp.]|uniref:glycerophosphodiester phosphodiesterase n=1 Tax=Galbibacter sp. TaxID=2918471 RepID=UPI003A92CF58
MKKVFLFLVCTLMLTTSCESEGLVNKVIAHRGAWEEQGLPENSIASLDQAIKGGYGGSELDIWMTADGVLVVCHDPTHQGLEIETSTYQELNAKKLPNGEDLPTLESYINRGQQQDVVKLILEIKTSKIGEQRNIELATKVVQLVHDLNARDAVEYICFDWNIGLKVISLDNKAVVSYLSWEEKQSLQEVKDAGYAGVDYHIKMYKKNPDLIAQAKQLGLITNVWTVNKKEDMQWFLDKDIDYITTDKPGALLELLKNQG